MKVMYIDIYGNKMEMESEEGNIVIPVMATYYAPFNSCKLKIIEKPGDSKPLVRRAKKLGEKMQLYTGEFRCPSEQTQLRDEWILTGLFDNVLNSEVDALMQNEWNKYVGYWHTTRCTIDGAKTLTGLTDLGVILYINNSVISDIMNVSCHVYGESFVFTKSLRNVLLFLHGDKYEVR